MRFMIIVKAAKDSEAGVLPEEKLISAMAAYHEEPSPFFAPLGMKNTAFSMPEANIERLATCYQTDFTTGKVMIFDEAHGGRFAHLPVFESGGGLVSMIDGLRAFGRMMLNNGKHGASASCRGFRSS